MERIVAQQRLRVADGLPVVAAVFVQGSQLLQRLAIRLRQSVALDQQPIAVAAGQQLAAVKRHGLLQAPHLIIAARGRPGLLQVFFERGNIQPAGWIAPPLHRQVICGQEAVRIRQIVAQAMPEVAEIGAGLLLGGVGPEDEGELLAGDRGVAMKQQVGEQFLQPSMVDPRDGFSRVGHAELPE